MKIEQEDIFNELLVMRTQNGDMEAFSLLVKRWQPALLRQAYRLTRDEEGALDVAQEVWRAIANGIYKLNTPAAFSTWSYKIVSNKSANWIKDQQKLRSLRNNQEVVIQEDSNEVSDNIDVIRVALNELPIKSRTILSMFYIDNYSVKKISEILSISDGTVKSRLFYARKMLKEKFETFKQ